MLNEPFQNNFETAHFFILVKSGIATEERQCFSAAAVQAGCCYPVISECFNSMNTASDCCPFARPKFRKCLQGCKNLEFSSLYQKKFPSPKIHFTKMQKFSASTLPAAPLCERCHSNQRIFVSIYVAHLEISCYWCRNLADLSSALTHRNIASSPRAL